MALRAFTALAGIVSLALAANPNPKRGLCFVPNKDTPQDNKIWTQSGSDLTWYWNYGAQPSSDFSGISQADFEFVPMMWGVGANLNDTTFLDTVRGLIKGGRNITHVLGFNEPDGTSSTGGSNIAPRDAAVAWVANFEPLSEMGVKLGLPACTGGWSSMPWLKQFLGNCSEIVSDGGNQKNCTWDFLPVHWYDNFAGLASHIGERVAEWPGKPIWVTEYAYANQNLQVAQQYLNQTLDYFDKESFIGRYSYFGAFRSKASNVGPQVTFLNNAGRLTDIGAWYLGFSETGVKPTSAASETISRSYGLLIAAIIIATTGAMDVLF